VNEFAAAAESALRNQTLRRNLAHATATIRERRALVVAEVEDWEQLRSRAADVKDHVLDNLPRYLTQFEDEASHRGAQVHWARSGEEARTIIQELVAATGADNVVKAKSLTTDEIGLNAGLEARGIRVLETDLAELIIQLAGDRQSHILVPAIHKNRTEIRDLFNAKLGAGLETDEPAELAETARRFLREAMLNARVGISGANFAIAETGAVCIVESEGNARMCTTLPQTVITLVGIEKLIPRHADLPLFLRLLARSATGEPLSPYTSVWAGATEAGREQHLVLLDAGRSDVLADPVGRQALRCIRCSACLNVCPVYTRTGGRAYGSIYPGPIGAILAPQLARLEEHRSLPYASTLCGACYDVCPVKINIPEVLVDLRRRVVASERRPTGEGIAMASAAFAFRDGRKIRLVGRISRLALRLRLAAVTRPGRAWLRSRDLPRVGRRR
jgi:L-lactate dehydrogenase complex protein LldF